MSTSEYLLEIRNLKTYFYLRSLVLKAVDGLSLNIETGKILGLVGESASGKTMTALSIMRVVPKPGKIVNGRILFRGENLLEKSESDMTRIRGTKISMIFQDPVSSLNPSITVGEQIIETIMAHQNTSRSEARRKAIEIMEELEIPSAEKRIGSYPFQLSGGLNQRIMIAIALSCNPCLLIADEPTTGLDVTIQAQVLDLIKKLRARENISVLLITHNLGIIAEMAQDVAVMYTGKIVEYSDVFSIFRKPKHPYTENLLASVPDPRLPQGRLKEIPGVVPNPLELPPGCSFHPRCSKKLDLCSREVPELIKLEKNHYVRCHLYGGG